jgi:hypothetical protein
MNKENLNLLSRDKLEELIEFQEQIILVNLEQIELDEKYIRILKNVKIKPFGLIHYFILFAITLSTIIISKHFGYEHKLSKLTYELVISLFLGYSLGSILTVILHNRMVKRIIDNDEKIKSQPFEISINTNSPSVIIKFKDIVLKEDSKEELERKLEIALENEAFELAAVYRDKLNKLNGEPK